MAEPSPFGALVRKYRTKQGVSQETLAATAGLSPGYVSMIETGDRGWLPSADVVVSIARALDASPAEFCDAAGIALAVPEAIADDPILTERQKQALLEHYRSYLDG